MAIRQPKPKREQVEFSPLHNRRMTEAEYLALPEEEPYLEYADGVVRQKPMPDSRHRSIVMFLNYVLYAYILKVGGHGGPEGRVRLPDRSGYRLPDTAYWVPGREAGDDSVPSLVIEVRSKDQPVGALRDKCRAFRANGVDVCWLIDPYRRWIEVFEGERDGVRMASDASMETLLMPGFSLAQSELWAALDR